MVVDIAIFGGGIVGLIGAKLLAANTNYSIAVIENVTPELAWDPRGYDPKVSAIALDTQQILQTMALWSEILATETVSFYKNMLVWDGVTNAAIEFSAADLQVGELGYIVENRIIKAVLWGNLQQEKNIKLIKANGIQLIPNINYQEIILNSIITPRVQAKLIIGADGANSWLRTTQGLKVMAWPINQAALVAIVRTEFGHENIARQVFNVDGPLAFLPSRDPQISTIVWSGPPDIMQQRLNLAVEQFVLVLAQAFSQRLGKINLLSQREYFPIFTQHAMSYLGHRTVLVGDAAHTIHPLAGQGLNLGVRDVTVLVELLAKNGLGDTAVGLRRILRQYERRRRGENLAMLSSMLCLKYLFSAENMLIKQILAVGMRCFNQVTWLKQTLANKAMGLRR